MEIIIKKEKAAFNKSDHGNEKLCVVVEFPDCISMKTQRSFKWMPTSNQLLQIKQALKEIEEESWNEKNN